MTLAHARLQLGEAAGPSVKKAPGLVKAIVDACLLALSRIHDDPAWIAEEEPFESSDEEASEGRVWQAASEAMDRIAKALGEKAVWATVREAATPYLASGEWQRRCAGLTAIASVVEGCAKTVLPQVWKG